jgi:hypothetical protein
VRRVDAGGAQNPRHLLGSAEIGLEHVCRDVERKRHMPLIECVCRAHIHDADLRAYVHPDPLAARPLQPPRVPRHERGIIAPVGELPFVAQPSHLGLGVQLDAGVIEYEPQGKERRAGGDPAAAVGVDLLFRPDVQVGKHAPQFFS